MGKLLFYSALLIGGYLVLKNYTGAERVIGAGGTLYTGGVKTLQGR